jgi:hypothetical protein
MKRALDLLHVLDSLWNTLNRDWVRIERHYALHSFGDSKIFLHR